MSMVYFKSDNTIVCMDSETSIDVSKSNTVTNSSVMSNRSAADDTLEGSTVVNVQGVVSYSKSPSQSGNPTPEEWVDLIEGAISNKERFTLYSVKYQGGNPLLKDYPNMVVQNYGYVVDRFEDTITVRITFKEIFVTDSANVVLKPVQSNSVTSSYQEPTTGGRGAATAVSTEKSNTYLTYIDGRKATVTEVSGNGATGTVTVFQ